MASLPPIGTTYASLSHFKLDVMERAESLYAVVRTESGRKQYLTLRCPLSSSQKHCLFGSVAKVSGSKVVVIERISTHTCGRTFGQTGQIKPKRRMRSRIVSLKAKLEAGEVRHELKDRKKVEESSLAARPLKREIKQLKSTGLVTLPTRRHKFPSEEALLIHLFAYSQQRDFVLDRQEGPSTSLNLYCKGQRSKVSPESHCSYQIKATLAGDGTWSIESASSKHDHRIRDLQIHDPLAIASSSSSDDDGMSDGQSDGGRSDVEIEQDEEIGNERQDSVEEPQSPNYRDRSIPLPSDEEEEDLALPTSVSFDKLGVKGGESAAIRDSTFELQASGSSSLSLPFKEVEIKPEMDPRVPVINSLSAVFYASQAPETSRVKRGIDVLSASESQDVTINPVSTPSVEVSYDVSTPRTSAAPLNKSKSGRAISVKASEPKEANEGKRNSVQIAASKDVKPSPLAASPPQNEFVISSLKRKFGISPLPTSILTPRHETRSTRTRMSTSKSSLPSAAIDSQLYDSSETTKAPRSSEPTSQPEPPLAASLNSAPDTLDQQAQSQAPILLLPKRKRSRWTTPREGTYSVSNLSSFVRSFDPPDLTSTLPNLASIGISSLDTLVDILSMEQTSIELLIEGVDEEMGTLLMKMVEDLHESLGDIVSS